MPLHDDGPQPTYEEMFRARHLIGKRHADAAARRHAEAVRALEAAGAAGDEISRRIAEAQRQSTDLLADGIARKLRAADEKPQPKGA